MKQYDVTLFVKGNSIEYMDWTDADCDEVLRDHGLTFVEEHNDGAWKDDVANKRFFYLFGKPQFDFSGLKQALNDNIKQCGFENLHIEKIVVWTLQDREKPYFEE